jgi:hypothetical protein
MKNVIVYFSLITSTLYSCGNQNPQAINKTTGSYYSENQDENLLSKQVNATYNEEETTGFFSSAPSNSFKTHQFRDVRTGLVVSTTKYPSDWNVVSKPSYIVDQKLPIFLIQIKGPNNLKTFNTPLKVHIAYDNPQTYQFMANSRGARLHRPLQSLNEILRSEAATRLEKSGFRYEKSIRLPKSENYLKRKTAAQGGHINLEILTTVWKNNKGQIAMASIGRLSMRQPLSFIDNMTLWMYSIDYLFVDEDAFDKTVQQFENALVSSKDNPQWIQYVQRLNSQRAQLAAQQHQINMGNRQAAFNAHQKKMSAISAAQDISHASFMNRNFGSGSNINQKQFINMINEEETVYNPLNGKNYQVNAGSTEYWMDSDGYYVQNNNLFYNPNGDINLNNRDWVRVKPAF